MWLLEEIRLTGDASGSSKLALRPENDIGMSLLVGNPLTGQPEKSLLQQGCSEKTLRCLFWDKRWMPFPARSRDGAQEWSWRHWQIARHPETSDAEHFDDASVVS